jgi:hypothetical protein
MRSATTAQNQKPQVSQHSQFPLLEQAEKSKLLLAFSAAHPLEKPVEKLPPQINPPDSPMLFFRR